MLVEAAAKPWTYWISPVLVIGAVLAVLAITAGYRPWLRPRRNQLSARSARVPAHTASPRCGW